MTGTELEPWDPPTEPPPTDDGDSHGEITALGIPAAVDAEAAVLGALLHGQHLEHRDALTPDDFWRPPHQTIYAAIRALGDRGEPTDAIAVGNYLRATEQVMRAGGLPYLHTLMAAAPASGGLGYHADLVADAATLRRLREAGLRVQQLAEHPGSTEIVAVVDRARAALDAVSATSDAHDEHASRGGWLDDLITERTLAYEQPRPVAVKTGFVDLDELLGGGIGLQPGQLVVVGARPGVGKSLVVGSFATNAAKAGWGVGMFSLEMTRNEIVDRVLAAASGVQLDRLTSHQLTDWDWTRIREARETLAGTPMYVDDRPGLTIDTIRARCRDLTRSCELGLIVVDYLQLITPGTRTPDRRVQVDALSRDLKLLAKEFSCPVVAAAQLNRGLTTRADKAPVLSDLRESGSLEQDADIVILAHRTDHQGELHLILAKQRGGVSDRTIDVAWAPSIARLSDLYRGPGEAW